MGRRHLRILGRLLLALPLAAVCARPASAQATVIDFEDVETTGWGTGGQTVIQRQYADRGVTFNAPKLLDDSKGIARPGFARSGTRAIEHCYSQEFCRTPFELAFARPQSRVRVWIGYSRQPRSPVVVLLEGFDSRGERIAFDEATLRPPGARAARGQNLPVRTPLEIGLDRPGIVRALVRMKDDAAETSGLALDDIEFEAVTRLPDLRIRLAAQAEDGTDRFTVEVENAGVAPAPATVVRLIGGRRMLAEAPVPALPPGQVHAALLEPALRVVAGPGGLQAHVDPDDRVAEANEGDNVVAVTLATMARVPDVVGTTLAAARTALAATGLVVALSSGEADPSGARIVAAQAPPGGTRLVVGGTVTLTLRPAADLWPWLVAAGAASAGAAAYLLRRRPSRAAREPDAHERAALSRVTTRVELEPGTQSVEAGGPERPWPHVALRFGPGTSVQTVEERTNEGAEAMR